MTLLMACTIVHGARAGARDVAKIEAEGVTEKLGARIPLDARFVDSEDHTVTLGQVITRPTVLAFIYFRCAGICPQLLSGIADVVNRMPLTPGRDYRIVTISFDSRDTPREAAKKKDEYFHMLNKDMLRGDWLFLTGDQQDIDLVTRAAGFSYQKDRDMFIHPTTLIVLTPDGEISQYLYGVSYVPSALELAITRAAQGKVGGQIVDELRSCFSFQPKGTGIAARVMVLTGVTVLACAAGFVAFLIITDPKRKARRKGTRS